MHSDPRNTWQFGIRIDSVRREILARFSAAHLPIEVFDPREKLSRTTDAEARQRIIGRWPDLDVVRVIVPLDDAINLAALSGIITEAGVAREAMDIIVGLLLRTDSEYHFLPDHVVAAIRSLGCKVTVNVTYNP